MFNSKGKHLAHIFAELPAAKKSKAKEDVAGWLEGKAVSETWSARLDKFVDFVSSVIESFLLRLFRACDNLAAHSLGTIKKHPCGEFQLIVELAIESRRNLAYQNDLGV